MVEAVSRHGFAGTTLRELVALAGVSRTTFYEHFENKQDCFLQALDELVSRLERLGTLHAEGVLTDMEFAAAKARVLGRD